MLDEDVDVDADGRGVGVDVDILVRKRRGRRLEKMEPWGWTGWKLDNDCQTDKARQSPSPSD